LAFLNALCAAWVAEDRGQASDAVALRLKAARYFAGSRIRSIDTRLLLLDVLRRAASWDAAEALTDELAAEELESPFVDIVTFHRGRIEARDSGRYTIAEALAGTPEPNKDEADPETAEAIARHLRTARKPDAS
jgi:hypothetical protein